MNGFLLIFLNYTNLIATFVGKFVYTTPQYCIKQKTIFQTFLENTHVNTTV